VLLYNSAGEAFPAASPFVSDVGLPVLIVRTDANYTLVPGDLTAVPELNLPRGNTVLAEPNSPCAGECAHT